MKKLLLLSFSCWFLAQAALQAQQDPMFTKYMFVPMNYNPAYAGSTGCLDAVFLHRHQWFGIQGGPMTQYAGLHSPINTQRNVSVGMNMTLDRIAVSRQFSAFGVFSYAIPFGNPEKKNSKGGYIRLGMQGGFSNWAADWSKLNLDNPNDPSFQNLQPNLFLPNFGAGIYVHTKTWFVGFSSPLLITNALRKRVANEPSSMPLAQQYRHYYLAGGFMVPLSPSVKFRPSALIKNVGLFMDRNQMNGIGAPTEFNVDAGFLFNDFFWVGTSFRSAIEVINGNSSYDSVDFWVSIMLKNGWRFGVGYDYTLTKLQGPAQGTYEIMLGYDLCRPNISKVEHVRYF